MLPSTSPRRHVGPAAAAVGLFVALVAGTLPAGAAPGDAPSNTSETGDIAAKRAEARALEREIEALGVRASLVLEEYLQAADALDAADAELLDLRAHVEELRRALEAAQEIADTRLVDLYRGNASFTPALYALDAPSVQEMGVVQHYARTLAAADRAHIDEVSTRREALAEEETRLEAARAEVAAQARALGEQRDEVEAAMAQRQAALDRAEGELAALVEEERRRRQEEEARRAREAMERRRREEEARRRAEEEARRNAPADARGTTTTSTAGRPADAGPPPPAPSSGSPPPPVHPNAGVAVDEARAQIGKPYQWGGNGPDSFDCSGLTKWAWAAAGVSIPRSSQTQYAGLPHVDFDDIQPGDLLFYGNPIHHVGIYVGNGEMVNAPYTGASVRVNSIYRSDYAGAARPG